MKIILLLLCMSFCTTTPAQTKDELAIREILMAQATAWNNSDIAAFMQGYWQNDSLMFISKSDITYGWQQTLANYKKGYPDSSAMGKLTFDILEVKRLSAGYYFVAGKWFLKRTVGDIAGHFTLLFRKIKNNWVIVADHSS